MLPSVSRRRPRVVLPCLCIASRVVRSRVPSVVHRSIATPASSTLVTRASSPANPRARGENNKRITAHHTHSLY